MSCHFKYEIDERNVRLQLKDHQIILRDEDWQRFHSRFSESDQIRKSVNLIEKYNISLNRNVVMPAVFGLIILGFALLLVNFISIKNPAKSKPEELSSVSTTPLKKTEAVSTNLKPEPAKTEPIESSTSSKSSIETSPTAAPAGNVSKQIPTENPPLSNSPALITSGATNANPAVAENTAGEQTKKKSKKRLLEAVESEQAAQLRPTLVSEDQEMEERPQ